MTIRILVTGSREWTDRHALEERLAEVVAGYPDRELVFVVGDCPSGADRMCADWVAGQRARGNEWVDGEVHVAHWNEQGKAAGPIRNQRMVDLGADLFLAFPTEKSVGTWDCIKRANRAGITVRIIPSRTK